MKLNQLINMDRTLFAVLKLYFKITNCKIQSMFKTYKFEFTHMEILDLTLCITHFDGLYCFCNFTSPVSKHEITNFKYKNKIEVTPSYVPQLLHTNANINRIVKQSDGSIGMKNT